MLAASIVVSLQVKLNLSIEIFKVNNTEIILSMYYLTLSVSQVIDFFSL